MAGILDLLAAQSAGIPYSGASPFAGLLTLPQGSFPPVSKELEGQALWDAIDADSAKANADADRRNSAGMASAANVAGNPTFPFAAPDAAGPGVAYALGKTPSDFGTYGAKDFVPSPFSIAGPKPPDTFGADAKPVPFAAGPVTAQPPAGPSTDLSSVNRNRAPDDFVSVGDYQMPAFRGEAPVSTAAPAVARGAPSAAAPFSLAGAGDGVSDRLMKATRGFLGNLGNGPIGALAGGLGALVTGQNTDPSSIAAEGGDLTARALMNKGASPDEVLAARKNPVLMKSLVDQYFGPKTVTSLGEGYVWDARAGKAVKAYDPTSKTESGIAEREAALRSRGLDPKEPRNQHYILTGKYPKDDAAPMTANDRKAIQDADEKILTVRGVIDNLGQAKKLSKQSYDGFLASQRGALGGNLGLEGGVNTADLENLVTGTALGQLKTIFGGNPTEGERKILLEVQGSVNLPDAVRQRIWDRAIAMAQNKLAMEEQRANELRNRTFYNPGGGMSGARAPAAAAPATGGTVTVGGQAINWSVK